MKSPYYKPETRQAAGDRRLPFSILSPRRSEVRGDFGQPRPASMDRIGTFRGCFELLGFREEEHLRAIWATSTHVIRTRSKLCIQLNESHMLRSGTRMFRVLGIEDDGTKEYRVFVRETTRGDNP